MAGILQHRRRLQIPWELLSVTWGYVPGTSASERTGARRELERRYPDLLVLLDYHPPPPCPACWIDASWENGIERTVDPGLPIRVDRLRALGNAVVPQVSERLGWRVRQILEHGPGPYG